MWFYEKCSAGEALRGHVMWFKDGQRLISQPTVMLVEWNLHMSSAMEVFEF